MLTPVIFRTLNGYWNLFCSFHGKLEKLLRLKKWPCKFVFPVKERKPNGAGEADLVGNGIQL